MLLFNRYFVKTVKGLGSLLLLCEASLKHSCKLRVTKLVVLLSHSPSAFGKLAC